MPGTNCPCCSIWFDLLLAPSILRQAGLTTAAHLVAFNLGLKSIPVDRRRHRDREIRLLAILAGIIGDRHDAKVL